MNSSKIFFLFILASLSTLITACDDDEPVIPNEEELITTLIYTLTPEGGGATLVFSFQDLDGDGGNAPIISSDTLAPNTAYDGVLELRNDAADPAEIISDEVNEEKDEHQFFFSSSVADVSFDYSDTDNNGFPLGLKSKLTTGATGNGTLTLILKHEPEKAASGVANGDITNAGGETDIEVQFNLFVQ